MSTNQPQTFNIDGQEIPCSLAWRIALRRIYRNNRRSLSVARPAVRQRGGYGPMGARQKVEEVIRHSGVRLES